MRRLFLVTILLGAAALGQNIGGGLNNPGSSSGGGLPAGCSANGAGITCTGTLTGGAVVVTGAGAGFTQYTANAFAAPGTSVLQFGSDISGNPAFSFNANTVLNVPGIANDICGTSLLPQICDAHFTTSPSLGTVGITITVANAAATGTTASLLAKINASGNAVLPATTDTGIPMAGVCTTANGGVCGTSGSANLITVGVASCLADNTVTTGDSIGVGTTTAGRCKSIAAAGTAPAAGLKVVGTALGSAVAGGAFNLVISPEASYASTFPTLNQIGAATATVSLANGANGTTISGTALPVLNAQTTSAAGRAFRASTTAATPTASVADVVGSANEVLFQVDKNGHAGTLNMAGTAPTITAGCGTSPSVTASSSDNGGQINVGTGGTAVSCTVTFHKAWTNAPFCIASASAVATGVPTTVTSTTGTVVFATTTAWPASALINWTCENGGG